MVCYDAFNLRGALLNILLLVWLIVNEADENNSHVVAAESAHWAVVGQTPGHQFFADDFRLKTLRQTGYDEIRNFLQNDIFVMRGDMNLYNLSMPESNPIR